MEVCLSFRFIYGAENRYDTIHRMISYTETVNSSEDNSLDVPETVIIKVGTINLASSEERRILIMQS